MKKNMLSKEDIKQVRVIVREEIDAAPTIRRLGTTVADLSVRMDYLEEDMTEVKENTRKILSNLDSYVKRSTDLEGEQKAHAAELNRHEHWIAKANRKLKITK